MPIVKKDGIRWLVDSGSSHTLVTSEGLRRLEAGSEHRRVRSCGCRLMTLGGRCPIIGEVNIALPELTGKADAVVLHVVAKMGAGYDGLVGCDVLAAPRTRLEYNQEWELSIGAAEKGATLGGEQRELQTKALDGAGGWLQELMREFDDVFYKGDSDVGTIGNVEHEIRLKEDRVTYVKPGRHPQTVREVIGQEIQTLVSQGVVRPSVSPFNSPVWAVKKKAGGYRMVVDYRQLNSNTVDEKYPVPRLEDALDRMAGAALFSTLDLKAGYHQVRMKSEDMGKTAFSFERGHYEFTRMPFGLKNAPRTFQRIMDEFLRGVGEDICQVYVDDIIVFSSSEGEHEAHLRKVLSRAREFGIKLSREKCTLAKAEVKFLGHLVSAEGVRPDPEKVAAVTAMKIPKTQRGVRSLLGALNFYRRFIPNMARRTAVLTDMLRKGARVNWTAEAEEGVKECVKELTREPVLAYPNFEEEFVVTTDASAYALGAVLAQASEKGERPVAYISRRLSPTEERYSAIERELLAIVWALENFRPYVYGRKFTIVTDHKPLQWVGTLKESSARVGRWKEKMMPYNYTIRHTPGKANAVADWLSRAIKTCALEESQEAGPSLRQFFQEWNPEGEGSEDNDTEVDRSREEGGRIEETEDVVNGKRRQIRWKTKVSGLDRMSFSREGRKRVYHVETTPGVPRSRMIQILEEVLQPGKTYHIYVGNEIIWRKVDDLYKKGDVGAGCTLVRCAWLATTVTDRKRQAEIMTEHHVGKTNHRGAAELVAAVRRRYYWDGMRQTAKETVAGCTTCGRIKAATRPPDTVQQVTPTAMAPLQYLEMDAFTWKGTTWITTVDTFSKLARTEKVEGRPTEAVINAIRQWCAVYGAPERITSDGGREFRNSQVEEEARRLEVAWHFTTPGYTRGRGCIERLHGTLSDHLRVIAVEQEVDATTAMERATAGYNHSIHSTTGYSPVEVVFGGEFRRRDPRLTAPEGEQTAIIENRKVRLHKRWRDVRDRIREEKARRVLQHNVRTTDAVAKIGLGTIVYKRIATNRRKEPERYIGPYRVVALMENGKYSLEDVDRPGRRTTAHIRQLKIPPTRAD